MQKINKKIGELLVEELKIPQKYVNETLKKAINEKLRFGTAASKLKLIDKEKINQALAIQYNLNYLDYTTIKKNLYYENYLEKKFYNQLFNFPTSDHYIEFCIENKFYILNDSNNETFFDNIFNKQKPVIGTGKGSIVILIGEFDDFQIDTFINKVKHKYKKIYIVSTNETLFNFIRTKYLSPILKEIEDFFKKVNDDEVKTDIALKMLLTYAISNNVSDLHIEPNYDNQYRVSGRKDGERMSFFYVNMQFGSKLIGVIKNKSKMLLEVKRKPQDGQLSGLTELNNYTLPIKRGVEKKEPVFNFSDTSLRISTYPNADNIELEGSISSESVVLRILNSDESLAILENLNLSKQTEKELLYHIKQRSGIIIVSGPTGAGKTTTLYALLSKLDYLSEKIITFEDPVEIRNRFWTQGEKNISTNINTNFSFLDAKKAILRQDPDIILMGEIRDEESAKFALEAANTGHLVFATLHANSSMLVVNRLMELGVEKSEIITSLRCAFSQRLVKRLCQHCMIKKDLDEEIIDFFKRNEIEEKQYPKNIYELNPNGCKFCNYTGFKGRVLIDEVIPFNNKIKEMFDENNNLLKLRKIITNKMNFKTMLLNGINKNENGIIPFSELNKLL